MVREVETYAEELNWLYLEGMHEEFEHTSQSENRSVCLRNTWTALSLFEFVRREGGAQADASPLSFLVPVSNNDTKK